jgi:hypothetical protein
LQDSAHRLHISAQRIIISSPAAIFSHIAAQLMHISMHMPHILLLIGDIRIMQRIAMSHMSMQSWSMHIISRLMEPFCIPIIIVSLHIVMHMQQSSIHRCMEALRSMPFGIFAIMVISPCIRPFVQPCVVKTGCGHDSRFLIRHAFRNGSKGMRLAIVMRGIKNNSVRGNQREQIRNARVSA